MNAPWKLGPLEICEVLGKSTDDFDREEKMPVYARAGLHPTRAEAASPAWATAPLATIP